ncbi:MAG TPA: hypothetical protein VGV35_17985 [Bryobacteraceae bacterium]|nr:hypothetical protein [Bryobacteraceae bacterium]
MRAVILRLLIALGVAGAASAQPASDEFRVYTDHPRLFLNAQRLRLLKRERDRDSMRWRQNALLVLAAAQLPEPGFAYSLYYAVTGDAEIGKRAVDWAVGPGADLRQLALVYDWCQPILSAAQSRALAAKIGRLIAQKPAATVEARRDRVLAVIATADDNKHAEEAPLRDTVVDWWRAQLAPKLLDGRVTLAHHELFALLELLHAIRDNLRIDLRENATDYFKELPKYQVLGNYPAPLAAPENEYRIPVYKGAGQPSVDHAALARAAGLSMVAYDNNALENQYLQGWLIQDRFMLQGTFGAPYEFLWANPYQPGLSYFQLPLLYHDKHSGALFLRSNWEDDAVWFGLYQGESQLFQDGRVTVLNRSGPVAPDPKPIAVGDASVLLGRNPLQFNMEGGITLIVGLKPRHKYLVEVDDEELRDLESDTIGTLVLEYPADRAAGVRIQEATNGNGGT